MATKHTIIVKDLLYFSELLETLLKFVPSCQFIIDNKSLKVNALNDAHTIRAFFETDAVVIEDNDVINFCLSDISKIMKAFKIIISSEKINSIKIEYDETFLKYDGGSTCFKFKTAKEKIIEQYITKPINAVLNTVFMFKTNVNRIKHVIQANAIVTQEESKVYLYTKNNVVMAEIDDKQNAYNDSIGLPISIPDSVIEGTLGKVTCIKFSDFVQFSILPSEDITIRLTDKNVFEINAIISRTVDEAGSNINRTAVKNIVGQTVTYFISMKMIAQILKV